MRGRSPDPSIPRKPYDPDTPNPGVIELLRQQEFCEEPNAERAVAALNRSHGKVFEHGKWVMDVPHSQATWEGNSD